MDKLERIQKLIAQSGLASRRQADDWVREGLVSINGKVAVLGQKADPLVDSIKVKGKLLNAKLAAQELQYFVFFKPRNVICALGDPAGRESILDFTKKIRTKLFPVGRLDFAAEGLVLLTNDGKFANDAQRSDKLIRVYVAKVKGHYDGDALKRLSRGGTVEDKAVRPKQVTVDETLTQKSKIKFVFEGPFSGDLKTFIESRGVLVEKITRTQLGHLTIEGLKPGEMKEIRPSSAQAMLTQPELGERVLAQNAPTPPKKVSTPRSVGRSKPGFKKFQNTEDSDSPRGDSSRGSRDFNSRGPRTDSRDSRSARPPRDFGSDSRAPRTDSRPSRDFGTDSRPQRAPRDNGTDSRSDSREPRSPRAPRDFGSDSRSPRTPREPRDSRRDLRSPRADSRGPRTDSRSPRAPRDYGTDSRPQRAPRDFGTPRADSRSPRAPRDGAPVVRPKHARSQRRDEAPLPWREDRPARAPRTEGFRRPERSASSKPKRR